MIELLGAFLWMGFMSIFGMFGQNAPEAPTDPASRARHFVSHCMTLLKTELIGAEIVELSNQRLVYRPAQQQASRVLSFEGGRVLCDGRRISELGDGGSLEFQRVSENQLQIDIASRVSEDARHRASVRLSVT